MWGARTLTRAMRGDPSEPGGVCGGVRQTVGMDGEPGPERGWGEAQVWRAQPVSETGVKETHSSRHGWQLG